jgi:hypothetical protein
MTASSQDFRLNVAPRKDGKFGYAITRIDRPDWAELSLETFATEEKAYRAGVRALAEHVRHP